jgi:hypothetical protein
MEGYGVYANHIWQRVTVAVTVMVAVCSAACGQTSEIDSFVAKAAASVFASVAVGDTELILLSHEESLRGNGVVSGEVYVLAFRNGTDLVAWHHGRLFNDYAAGYTTETEFVLHLNNPETSRSELCYFDLEQEVFRAFTVRPLFIGGTVIWGDTIFYSTEHFEDNLHYVDINDGEVHMVQGSGETGMNSDFWIIDGALIVTDGGDKGIPYRLDTEGLYPAPDVTVSPETKVGFNLRTIRDGEGLERFEELLGIR